MDGQEFAEEQKQYLRGFAADLKQLLEQRREPSQAGI
jgi:hypothetical protein